MVNDGAEVEAGLGGISQVASTEGQGKSSFDWHPLVLLLIILAGALLRLYNVQWDEGQLTHPDERSTIYFYATTMHWPQDLKTALDPRQSPLNPLWDVTTQQSRSYTYGHFPLYVLVGVANGFHELGLKLQEIGLNPEAAEVLIRANQAPDLAFVGRTLMALADTASIYLIYLIARRLYGRGAGLLAAAFSAFTVLQIQLAHFFAVDPASATFTFLALYGAMRMVERRTVGAAVVTGLGAGLAVACKFSAAPIALAPVVAVLIAVRQSQGEERPYTWGQALWHLLVAGLVALVSFVVTSPYVLLDFENFRQAVIVEQGGMVSGARDLPFTRQYRGTLPYVYFIEQQVRWGMGWPLGVVAVAGFAWVLIRALRRRALPGEWILLSWIVPYFGLTGLFLAKFMRYMVPVTPLWVVFGAGMLVRWKDGRMEGWKNGRIDSSNLPLFQPSRLSRLASVGIVIALVGAVVWSLAFVNGVYGTEHTWITASKWIYDHVADGSVICAEHWDDELPKSLPDQNRHMRGYKVTPMPMYEEDTAQKYELIRSMLARCDYIALATNRLYGSIPGLPERYPMSTRYYDLLFAEQLGFEKAAEFETPPRLGPLVFYDQAADESFTVYDHPKSILFRKTRDLTDLEWEALLGGSWQGAVPHYVGELPFMARLRASLTRNPLPQSREPVEETGLLLDRPVGELPVVSDFGWNRVASRSPVVAVLVWWLAVDIVALAAWPITYTVFSRLRDRGHLLSRSLGLVVLGYLVWLPSSLQLLRNGLPFTLAALALLVVLSGFLFRRRQREMVAFWKENARLILFEESLFALAFLAFVFIRVLNPDLWQPWFGGEKSMEIAYINASLKSAYLPPHDPYFAHGYLNYYYYGQFFMTLLMRLTGVAPEVGFNLSVPLLFALTVGNAFTVAYNLTVRKGEGVARTAGLIAAGLIAISGNLAGAVQVIDRLAGLSGSAFESGIPGLQYLVRAAVGLGRLFAGDALFPGYDYWGPTRVIPETINEFPFFSFLFADLHPHMINLPFTILFVALLLSLVRRPQSVDRRPEIASWLALPFILGAVAVINTWDLPAAAGLLFLALFVVRWSWKRGWGNLIASVLVTGLVGALALALYRPFFSHYKTVALGGVGLAAIRTRTSLGPFLAIWGLFLFLALSYIVVELRRRGRWSGALRFLRLLLVRWETLPRWSELHSALVRGQTVAYRSLLWGLAALSAVTLALAALKFPVPALMLLPVALSGLLLLRWRLASEEQFIGLLVFTGLLMLLGLEVFYLRDHLDGGPAFRMNTLFKFYIQVWVLFGLGFGAALPRIWEAVGRWQSAVSRGLWTAALILLVFGSLIYPALATPVRVSERFPGARPPVGTLDGLAFMTVGHFSWPDDDHPIELKWDYEAIRWLQENVAGTPVVAEAALGYYREHGGRVASYTGLPTLLGHHQQGEQRWGSQTGPRSHEANVLFNGGSIFEAQQIIEELDIRYIYIGQLERNYYNAAGLEKFEQMAQNGDLRVVFRNEGTTIYEVN
jgi:YYY domain-containing protein